MKWCKKWLAGGNVNPDFRRNHLAATMAEKHNLTLIGFARGRKEYL